jgi:hypothetical protein
MKPGEEVPYESACSGGVRQFELNTSGPDSSGPTIRADTSGPDYSGSDFSGPDFSGFNKYKKFELKKELKIKNLKIFL